MSYEVFQSKVNAMIARAGGGIRVRFFTEEGRFIARCSDGTTITTNTSCPRVKVRWGSGHVAYATI